MAKRKTTPENENSIPHAIAPVSVTETDSHKAKDIMLEVPEGYVLIVGLNEDGSEKVNSGFFYPERSYKRIYGDETKYMVKKKAQ